MAVPKSKVSKARRDKRRANWKLTAPQLVKCPSCGAYRMPHRICPSCGMYDGRSYAKVEANADVE
ncbi:MAG: 50S ribosomal protein L32 [Clostridiales bacterium]|nr:50S ribosomal protein L32 [Clostridiales bacterium]MCD8084993.1 50S ribosomal protein L32 [Clostridiales bacterium]MCD8160198.1 50S ribosomal protein L32 [Clostridiales bacterium]